MVKLYSKKTEKNLFTKKKSLVGSTPGFKYVIFIPCHRWAKCCHNSKRFIFSDWEIGHYQHPWSVVINKCQSDKFRYIFFELIVSASILLDSTWVKLRCRILFRFVFSSSSAFLSISIRRLPNRCAVSISLAPFSLGSSFVVFFRTLLPRRKIQICSIRLPQKYWTNIYLSMVSFSDVYE